MFQELGDGVYRRRYESLDANVGVVLGEEGVLIIDTRSNHAEGDEIRSDLSTLTRLPVRWVVNTHWHWDHVFGNSRFEGAEIWGHQRTREVLLTRPDEMREGAVDWVGEEARAKIDEVVILPPASVFSERVSIDIGRPVELSYHGLGHTDGDIRIVVPDTGVAFLGDLIEEGGPPSFGDSYPLLWPLTLHLAMVDAPDLLVPGHGDVVDRRFVDAQHQELVAVAQLAEACVAGDMAIEAASTRGPYSAEVMRSALTRAVEIG